MRRVMLTLAVVLVVGVVEVKAQGHGAPATPAAKGHETPATKAHEAPAAKAHEAPVAKGHEAPAARGHETPAAKAPVDVATVLKRINQHVAEVTEIGKSRPAVRSAPAGEPKTSPAPRAASHTRAAAPPPAARARVELDWHTPRLVWPEDTLQAMLVSPPNSK